MPGKSIILAATFIAATSSAATNSKPPAPNVDQRALDALVKMGTFLRAQSRFSVRTTTETEYALGSGQKVRLVSNGEIDVERPNHLYAATDSQRKTRRFFYDGKSFTIYAPRVGYYATVVAPPTVHELADQLEDRYGLELPLVDLFRWGTSEADTSAITSAVYVGTATIDGMETDQYAFRQPGLDWQVWIERVNRALPLKLVLTTTDDPAKPEHSVDLAWKLDTVDVNTFTFVPPAGTQRIAIGQVPPPNQTAQNP